MGELRRVRSGQTIAERLEFYSMPEPMSGCQLWIGRCFKDGYAQITFEGMPRVAHRLSWITHRGEIPDGLNVLHKCDVRCCINPRHLKLGTHRENIDDMMAKGRHLARHLKFRILSEAQAQEALDSEQSDAALGEKFGVSPSAIWAIRRGYNWKHLSRKAKA